MKVWYKKDQDWKIKDPQKLEVIIISNDMGCPDGYIENGLSIWKKGGLDAIQERTVPDVKPEAKKIVRATSKKKSQKKR